MEISMPDMINLRGNEAVLNIDQLLWNFAEFIFAINFTPWRGVIITFWKAENSCQCNLETWNWIANIVAIACRDNASWEIVQVLTVLLLKECFCGLVLDLGLNSLFKASHLSHKQMQMGTYCYLLWDWWWCA